MNLIPMMPAHLGKQVYPYGTPLNSHCINVNGKSVSDIFIQYIGAEKESPNEIKVLENYMRYYINAPCFIISETDKIKAETLAFDELLDLCMNNGLDPF